MASVVGWSGFDSMESVSVLSSECRGTSTLRRRLASRLAVHRSQLSRLGSFAVATVLYEVWRASCPFCLYRHPALVRRSCASPSMAARAPSSRRPVSARSLRCGLRSSFLVTTPSLRSVATTRLHATSLTFTRWQAVSFGSGLVCFTGVHPRFPASCRVPPGGIVPPGYVMRRPSGSPCLRRVRSIQAGGFLPKIATHFVCVAAVAFGSRKTQAFIRPRCGSDGLQVRSDGESFGRRRQLEPDI